jgi:putative tryptophan/tyrosine transport system substrate-binding protein
MLPRYSTILRLALLVPILVFMTTTVRGQDCIVLQSSSLKPYEEARQGFELAWQTLHPSSGPKSVTGDNLTQILLTDQPEVQPGEKNVSLSKKLKAASLVVVIGDPALKAAREITDIPVVYLLSPSASNLTRNFTGIDLRIRPSQQLAALNRLLPRAHAIGALYNPAQTGQWVQEALAAPTDDASQILIFKKITTPGELPDALGSLRGKIDILWLLPDDLVTTTQAMTQFQEFSIANRVPVLSFSEKYLKTGAAVVITSDLHDMGAQAAAMAARIAGGTQPEAIPTESPRRVKVIANTAVLLKMGVSINESAVDEVFSGGLRP